MTKDLYTSTDVRNFKELLINKQCGIDPILKEKFKEVVVLDHDHITQHCRGALNRNSNAFEGLVYNAYKRCLSWLTDKPLTDILRNLADYLEKDSRDNPYHPGWIKHTKVQFNKLNAKQQDSVLISLGGTKCKNPAERKQQFSKLVLNRELGFEKIRDTINKTKGNI